MIDFTKLLLPPHYFEPLLNHSLLSYQLKNVGSNGEVIYSKNGISKTPFHYSEYNDIEFKLFTTGKIIIQGSLHKYYNGGSHNFNDFGKLEVSETIKRFLDTFAISPEEARILILEYGLNINPPYSTELILENLFFHKKTPFKSTETRTEGNYLQAKHDRYRLKVYDKQKQYKNDYQLPNDILRIELHTKGAYIRPGFKIVTLSDLMNFDHRILFNDLVNQFNISLFYDFTIKHHSKRLLNHSNRNYWSRLIREKKESLYSKQKGFLNNHIKNHSENVMIKLIQTLETKFNDIYNGGTLIPSILDVRNNTPLHSCKITGYDISMQKPDSSLLSHAGIRFYKQHHPKVFNHLKYVFLSKVWHLEEEDKQIKEIAHNIRNKYYNNIGRNRYQLTLPFMESTLKRKF